MIVKPSEEVILLHWGKFFGVIREPGMYYVSPIGIEQYRVSLRQHTTERNGGKSRPRRGSVRVSGVVVYRIKHAMHAMFGCDSYTEAVKDQVDLTLKRSAQNTRSASRVTAVLAHEPPHDQHAHDRAAPAQG